ncbi:hypothetical protein [Streptomyces anulatus]|uniref:hypothetical protein n=1 Tax=Streptomyces anulatus TaxID=1892 RepID=UPI002E80FBA0|nr:hypothetical protein [Streptomyces anulatus]WUC88771.1 hypothetical protein OHQ35_22945 [Streptomyces anulatus]
MTTLTQRPLPAVGPDGVNPSRARSAVRALYTRPALTAGDLSAPLLALPDGHPGAGRLPGAVRLSDVRRTVARWRGLGIGGVKAFALGHDRDNGGSTAVSSGNLMVQAVSAIREVTPDLAVTTEVCGCSWTSSGECVLRTPTGRIDLDATYRLMGEMAVQHAESGADVVSPTAMLDGSVRAVRAALDDRGLRDVGVNPNLAIHTTLYGPFKALMTTDPAVGHRRGLQLEQGRAQRDTVVQARRWIAEGADSLTLQPVMTAVDVLVRLRADQEAPLVAYSTSGEWPALRELGSEGMVEYIAMLRRAGADHVLTFAAEQVAAHLEQNHG